MRFLRKFMCLFFGHKYVLTQQLSKQSRRVACTRCREMFAMNDDVRAVVSWNASFHELYEQQGVQIKYKHWEAK